MAKVIMIQGTMSNVGKSLLVAGLCRVLKQDGYKVAPFKSQNMALNSFITEEGLEMGRAQVVQAEAAKIKPSCLMNPILLKPTNDVGSQVIVNGKVVGTMKASEYFKKKKDYIPAILEAYRSLAEEYDIIVVEGAGSPAEINLKQDDIVNMGLAKLLDAPVLLAGDIDRGGVFAQLLGTIMLLENEEQDRIKGLIINKFRGDVSILQPGVTMLEELAKKPVTGVVPYMDVDIEDEDSLCERFDKQEVKLIDIVVIRLPRISNFTDFNALEEEQVSVRYVTKPSEMKNPDLIILPGTKNTLEDLIWLRESGLEAMILKHVSRNGLLLGICGGYQMLGKQLSDPYGVEAGGTVRGLGLLPMDTEFTKEKTRTQVTGKVQSIKGAFAHLSGCAIEGYEIHMGQSNYLEANPDYFLCVEHGTERKLEGLVKDNVFGTYVHGVLDSAILRERLIELLFSRKGYSYEKKKYMDRFTYKEIQYNKLADTLRESLDMEQIYKILGLEKKSES